MNIIATIHAEIDTLSERRAELWHRLSDGRDPELVRQIKGIDDRLEALFRPGALDDLLPLGRRERELAAAVAARGVHGEPAAAPDEARLAEIEDRLAELREGEKLFLRTRDELAARSEAVAAREWLVAQKERELDEREDASPWATAELSEVEARLRRLEQRQLPGEPAAGFADGLRKLQQGAKRPQRPV